MDYVVRRITPAETRPLRQQLLRQGVPLDKLVYAGDLAEDTLHVGAFSGDEHIGIATVMRQPPTISVGTPAAHPDPENPQAWRLRGMAVADAARGKGAGAAMLQACISHVAQQGGAFMWCDARLVAVGFYHKCGLNEVGEQYMVPDVGPHFFMQRIITPTDI